MPRTTEGFQVSGRIRSVADPTLVFECDFIIDTGCLIGPLRIPAKKARDLQLSSTGVRHAMAGGGPCPIQFYSPVQIELEDSSHQLRTCTVDPFSSPSSAAPPQPPQVPPPPQPPAPSPPLKDHSPPHSPAVPASAPTIRISPVKFPIPAERTDLDQPLLGPAALELLHLHIDSKRNQLYFVMPRYR